jgi:hypothetical protein
MLCFSCSVNTPPVLVMLHLVAPISGSSPTTVPASIILVRQRFSVCCTSSQKSRVSLCLHVSLEENSGTGGHKTMSTHIKAIERRCISLEHDEVNGDRTLSASHVRFCSFLTASTIFLQAKRAV